MEEIGIDLLEYTVLMGTPQEITEICKSQPKGTNFSRALALACRFRGLEHVKVLAENGAAIRGREYYYPYYWLALLNMNNAGQSYIFSRIPENDHYMFTVTNKIADKNGKPKMLKILSAKQRVEIIRYLCENRERVNFDPGELLFYSIMGNDKQVADVLKAMGVTFSEKRIAALTGSRLRVGCKQFYNMLDWLDDEDFFNVLQKIVKEVGEKKLHYFDIILHYKYNPGCNRPYCSEPGKLRFILEHFDQKQMNKMAVMVCAVNAGSMECLEICTKLGWLTKMSDCDELIKCASENGRTECLAWLLDFKNRNFDLAAEREKAARIARRKLNASPGSVIVLRELFRWKKQEDGTLVITGYKGTSDVIYVPKTIGRNVVTAIGIQAFSIRYSRNIPKDKDKPWFKVRRRLSKVVLPDGIKSIGYEARLRGVKSSKA